MPVFFRPSHAQSVVGISRSTIYRWIAEGHFTPIKRGTMTFIRTQDVVDYIEGLGD